MNEKLSWIINHPLHQYLGITDVTSDQGRGSLSFTVSENTFSPAGVLHGGVLYLLTDVCAYAGLMSVIEPDEEAVTHDIHVSVLRAAKAHETVKMESRIIKKGRKLCFIDVTATVSDQLIATARITKSLIRKSQV